MDANTNHTPGPWTVNQSREFYADHEQPYQIWHIVDGDEYHEDNQFVARLSDNWTDEGKANARLIAAAPDMLAACVDLVQLWDSWAEHSTQLAEPLRRSIEMRVDQARAAVELTKG